MAGLIASALAGGIAGAGAAAGTALGRMQETEEKKSFEMMRSELEMQRQTAIENLRFANQEKGAVSAQLRGRDDFKWQRTGEGGTAAREAALADMTQKYDFENDSARVDRAIEIAGRKKRVETDNEGVTLGVGQQRIVGGKVVADNNSGKYIDALTARASRVGGGGEGGGKNRKLSPEATAEINDINDEEKSIQRSIDAATTEAAKTGGDASGGAFQSLQRRMDAVQLRKMRAFAKHGIIDPVKDAQDVIAGDDIDEIGRAMMQAKMLGSDYSTRFYNTVIESGVLQREQPGRAVPAAKEAAKQSGIISALRRGPPPSDAGAASPRAAPVGRAGQATSQSMDDLLSKPITRPGQGGSSIDPRTGLPR